MYEHMVVNFNCSCLTEHCHCFEVFTEYNSAHVTIHSLVICAPGWVWWCLWDEHLEVQCWVRACVNPYCRYWQMAFSKGQCIDVTPDIHIFLTSNYYLIIFDFCIFNKKMETGTVDLSHFLIISEADMCFLCLLSIFVSSSVFPLSLNILLLLFYHICYNY